MNHEIYEVFLASSVFKTLPKETQELLHSIMSTPTGTMDTKEMTAEGAMMEVIRMSKRPAPKVVDVLVEFPKSPRTPRLKLIATKESAKDKKGKQVVIPLHASPRINP